MLENTLPGSSADALGPRLGLAAEAHSELCATAAGIGQWAQFPEWFAKFQPGDPLRFAEATLLEDKGFAVEIK
jgi:hypothetical protein